MALAAAAANNARLFCTMRLLRQLLCCLLQPGDVPMLEVLQRFLSL
jgi:hypothetical protein